MFSRTGVLLSCLAVQVIASPLPESQTGAAPAPFVPGDTTSAGPICQSFGVDFKDGGAYFQNISSSDPFTFVSSFQGCQPDLANNLLVDPSGQEWMCTNTTLTPDGVNQLATCPLLKNQLTSGAWSVLLISNNGNGAPIAYERDFILTVGIPSTYTYTPTVTISVTTSKILSTVVTITDTDAAPEITTATVTTSQQGATITDTITVTPTTTLTDTVTSALVSKTKHVVRVVITTVTRTAGCSVPPRQWTADPLAIFTPTLVSAAAMETNILQAALGLKKRGAWKVLHGLDNKVPINRDRNLLLRKSRLASLRPYHTNVLGKRAPDSATVRVTETDSALFPVATSYLFNSTSTLTLTSTALRTETTTRTIIIVGPTSQAPTVTATAPTVTTTTATTEVVAKTVTTKTYGPTITLWDVVRPSSDALACKSAGGIMI